MPKVSIIVYVKNTETYIGQCIQSIIDQSERDIEIIIVDGESSDGTVDIIKSFEGKDSRIKFFSKGGGVGIQFNYGLEMATGEYIAVVEADDFIPEDMIERQYIIAKENNLDIIKAGYYYYLEVNGDSFCYPFDASETAVHDRLVEYDQGKMLLDVGINGFWSGMYSKSFIVNNNIRMSETPGASYQDISFSFMTQLYARRVWFMSDHFYRYRIDNPDASVNSMAGIKKHIYEYEKLRYVLTSINLWNEYKYIFFKWMALSFEWYIAQFPNEDVTDWINESFDFLHSQMKDEYECLLWEPDNEKLLKPIIDGKTAYFVHINTVCDNNRRLDKYIHHKFKEDDQFVVLGFGNIGKAVVDYLSICKKKVILADNNKEKQGNEYNGSRIFSTEDICKMKKDATYIIANTLHYGDMQEQLMELGIRENLILVVNDRGFWLRKIFPTAREFENS